MGLRRLMDALREQPEPPCTGCPHYRECATRNLACWDFLAYVKEPTTDKLPAPPKHTRTPSAAWYAVVHETQRGNKGRPKPQRKRRRRARPAVLKAVA